MYADLIYKDQKVALLQRNDTRRRFGSGRDSFSRLRAKASFRTFLRLRRTAMSEWKQTLLRSNMHGLPQMLDTNSPLAQKFWTVVFFIMFTSMVSHLCFVLYKAFMQPTVTKTEYVRLQNMTYPPTTVCSLRGYMLNSAKLRQAHITLEQANTVLFAAPFFGYGILPGEYNVFGTRISEAYWNNFTTVLSMMDRKPKLSRDFSDVPFRRFFDQYAHTCDEFFDECRDMDMNRLNCCAIFRPIYHLFFGRCFALDVSSPVLPRVNASDRFSMLYLWIKTSALYLDLETSDHVVHDYVGVMNSSLEGNATMHDHHAHDRDWLTDEAGVALIIGDGVEQSIWPSKTKALAPLSTYHVSVEFMHIRRRAGAQCVSVDDAPLWDFENYTLDNCVWERNFLQPLYKSADCVPAVLSLTNPARHVLPTEFCNLSQIRSTYKQKTVAEWMTELEISSTNPCKPLCEDWTYSVDMTRGDAAESDRLHLTIAYAQDFYLRMEEVLALQWHDYLSLLGGLLGLWLGTSMITVIHLLVYGIFRFVMFIVDSCKYYDYKY